MTHPNGYPDLQLWVGFYDGYQNIPWDQWDAAVREFENAAGGVRKGEGKLGG
jgi:hypothetical protein